MQGGSKQLAHTAKLARALGKEPAAPGGRRGGEEPRGKMGWVRQKMGWQTSRRKVLGWAPGAAGRPHRFCVFFCV